MKINEETKRVLVRSGLGWVVPLLPEFADVFKVELIDLDTLSLGPEGGDIGNGEFWAKTKMLLFGAEGKPIGEVGGQHTSQVNVFKWSWKWPFIRSATESETYDVYETVEQAVRRIPASDQIRFIVSIPKYGRNSGTVIIRKLRASDKDLKARLQQKADEEVENLNEILAR